MHVTEVWKSNAKATVLPEQWSWKIKTKEEENKSRRQYDITNPKIYPELTNQEKEVDNKNIIYNEKWRNKHTFHVNTIYALHIFKLNACINFNNNVLRINQKKKVLLKLRTIMLVTYGGWANFNSWYQERSPSLVFLKRQIKHFEPFWKRVRAWQ